MAITGQGGSIQAGSTTYYVESWSIDLKTESLDVTDTGSGGWRARLAGLKEAVLDFSAFYNPAQPLIGDIVSGETISFTATIGGAIGDTIAGSFIVVSVKPENPAGQAVKVTVNAESTGAIVITASSS